MRFSVRYDTTVQGVKHMATWDSIEYEDASPDVQAIYDDIMLTRNTDWINTFGRGSRTIQ